MNIGQWGVETKILRQIALYGYLLATTGLAITTIIAINRLRQTPNQQRHYYQLNLKLLKKGSALVYFTFLTLLIVAGSSRTSFPSAYYMLIGVWTAGVALLLIIDYLSKCFERRWTIYAVLSSITLLPHLVGYLTHFTPGGAVSRGIDNSKRLISSFNTISALVDGSTLRILRIVLNKDADFEYYFFTGNVTGKVDQDLGPFIFQSAEAHPMIELIRSDKERSSAESQLPIQNLAESKKHNLQVQTDQNQISQELTVFLFSNYALNRVRFDGHEIVFPQRSAQ